MHAAVGEGFEEADTFEEAPWLAGALPEPFVGAVAVTPQAIVAMAVVAVGGGRCLGAFAEPAPEGLWDFPGAEVLR